MATITRIARRGLLAGLLALAAVAPAAAQTGPIVPQATPAAASSLVLNTALKGLYAAQVTAGASAGFLMVFDAAAVPADGTVAPAKCYAVPAATSLGVTFAPSLYARNGWVLVFSTGANCFTKAASATAFLSAEAS